jgi:hypothetical protein
MFKSDIMVLGVGIVHKFMLIFFQLVPNVEVSEIPIL